MSIFARSAQCLRFGAELVELMLLAGQEGKTLLYYYCQAMGIMGRANLERQKSARLSRWDIRR